MIDTCLRFIAVVFSKSINIDKCIEIVIENIGETVVCSKPYDFNRYTSYYTDEMGEGLTKIMMLIKGYFNPHHLANLKKETMSIENHYRVGGARKLNIDPGYITPSKLVLATHKDYAGAIALLEGINAIVELIYHGGTYRELLWTYRDYSDNIPFFNDVRKYMELWL
ncbi:MAG: hypothetical protein B6D57_04055 [Candidatus Coatesbacteria bacterium 4484_99]|uniref:DUF4416 domain-containing protein n=1 Tax=Candidatus Coatesbacteria bacterium 4484_99 TaxID=1970774 RepID=A0A1W9S0P0_9BACT|nr:MAG: hypothetical protein B6D57_04055 [Candidatus Coatesbacteria bacterium 4484_99]